MSLKTLTDFWEEAWIIRKTHQTVYPSRIEQEYPEMAPHVNIYPMDFLFAVA